MVIPVRGLPASPVTRYILSTPREVCLPSAYNFYASHQQPNPNSRKGASQGAFFIARLPCRISSSSIVLDA